MPPHYINTLQNNTKEDTLSFLIYFFNIPLHMKFKKGKKEKEIERPIHVNECILPFCTGTS